jgi:epoxyqueuosine reductase
MDDGNEAAWVEGVIKEFLRESPENTLKDSNNEKAWEDFIVGFSRGDDPIWGSFKEHVGPFHWTPLEIFRLAHSDAELAPADLTVIAWVLPQREATKSDNRKETIFPSERWARARIYGEETNVKLRKHLISALESDGHKAVAPLLSPLWEWKKSDRFVFSSNWSERHAAYASGLGTFGLCDGLITPVGKAMRVGSVVADVQIPPTPRTYSDHHAYCLFYSKGICGKCIQRCPAGALSESGHDKIKCANYLKPGTSDYVKARYGFDGYGCGLCQTKVPCESKIPDENDEGVS